MQDGVFFTEDRPDTSGHQDLKNFTEFVVLCTFQAFISYSLEWLGFPGLSCVISTQSFALSNQHGVKLICMITVIFEEWDHRSNQFVTEKGKTVNISRSKTVSEHGYMNVNCFWSFIRLISRSSRASWYLRWCESPAKWGTRFGSWVGKILEEGIATHYSILAWRIPRTEEPGSQTVGHNWSTKHT